MRRAVMGEFLGTALMVGVGCGSVALGAGHLLVSLTFGVVVTVAILLFGPWSGAHINPAVSLAFWRSGHLESARLLPYWLAQCSGALLAAWTVGAAAPTTVAPSLSLVEAFLVEVGITAALMLSIFIVLRRTQRRLIIAAWVGGTVAVLALIAGPLTGASMNPARTFGPNLLSGLWGTLPFYFISTALGAWFAVDLDRRLHRSP